MMISRACFPCEAPAKKDRHSATPQTSPLSVSSPASHPHFPRADRDGKKERTRGRALWIRFGGGWGGVGGCCLYDDFSFEEREKHQSSAGFLWGFNTALSPVVCGVVSSECYVFDMRVNNVQAGKCSVCVFTAPHTPRWGGSLALTFLLPSRLWRAGARRRIKVCLFYV